MNKTGKEDNKPKEVEKDTTKLNEVLQQKYVRFKPKQNTQAKENEWCLIFRDNRLAQAFIKGAYPNTSVLTYIECTLTIDGLVGLSCGELFQIDGIPEIYNEYGFFQIMNIKQAITDAGWRTTIEASYRYNVPDAPREAAKPT